MWKRGEIAPSPPPPHPRPLSQEQPLLPSTIFYYQLPDLTLGTRLSLQDKRPLKTNEVETPKRLLYNHYPRAFRRKSGDILIPRVRPAVRLQCHTIAPRPFKLDSRNFQRQ